ncbi:MAG: N5-glutamine methyltransferase family protein, partial [Alphaproteobacteria bacterium]
LQSDLFSNLSTNLRFDILLSNPPYIPSHQIDLLEDEVRKHDPICALDGGKDGLNFYRSIAKNSKKFLKEHGYLYLEIGINQYDAVKDIFENDGWCLEKFQKDLAGIIRVLKFKQA